MRFYCVQSSLIYLPVMLPNKQYGCSTYNAAKRGQCHKRKAHRPASKKFNPTWDIRPLQDRTLAPLITLNDLNSKRAGAMSETAYERQKSGHTETPQPPAKKRGVTNTILGASDIPASEGVGSVSNTRSKTLIRKWPRAVGAPRRR